MDCHNIPGERERQSERERERGREGERETAYAQAEGGSHTQDGGGGCWTTGDDRRRQSWDAVCPPTSSRDLLTSSGSKSKIAVPQCRVMWFITGGEGSLLFVSSSCSRKYPGLESEGNDKDEAISPPPRHHCQTDRYGNGTWKPKSTVCYGTGKAEHPNI